MRLLIITHVWEPEIGVPQRRWAWLTSALTSGGHQVDVVAPPPHYPTGRLQSDRLRHRTLRNGPGDNGEHVWRTMYVRHDRGLLARMLDEAVAMAAGFFVSHRRIRNNRPHLLVATAPPLPAIVTAAVLGKVHRIPVLMDVRDTWPDLLDYVHTSRSHNGKPEGRHIRRLLFGLLSPIGRRAINWGLRRADGVITTSQSFGKMLHQRGIRRTLCVYNVAGLPSEEISPPPEKSRSLHVLYAGTTGRAQELASALRAISQARSTGADIRLRIIGGGAHMRTLRKNAQRLKLPVEFLRRVPREEIASHYEWADTVLVQLQSWSALRAAIPSKIFEVMAYGRHITASLDGESAVIIRESGAGDCVPAQDEMALSELLVELYRNRSRLFVQGNGRAWLEEHANPNALENDFLDFVATLGNSHD